MEKCSWNILMTDDLLDILRKRLASEKSVSFAYLFGSHARQNTGNLSDIDIAIFLGGNVDFFHYRLKLTESIEKMIGGYKVDIIVLNRATPLLAHEIVKTGVLLKENKDARIDFEIKSLQEYLDTQYLRDTQRLYIKKQLNEGTYFG